MSESQVARFCELHIETHLVAESVLFSILPHVNKIVLGCHAVLANGGLIATSGAFHVLNAAAFFHTPVYVCTGMFKICPMFPNNSISCALLQSPLAITPALLQTPGIVAGATGLETVLDPEQNARTIPADLQLREASDVHIVNPTFDYIAPDRIGLFITNERAVAPSYIYRLLAQLYNPEDTFFV